MATTTATIDYFGPIRLGWKVSTRTHKSDFLDLVFLPCMNIYFYDYRISCAIWIFTLFYCAHKLKNSTTKNIKYDDDDDERKQNHRITFAGTIESKYSGEATRYPMATKWLYIYLALSLLNFENAWNARNAANTTIMPKRCVCVCLCSVLASVGRCHLLHWIWYWIYGEWRLRS